MGRSFAINSKRNCPCVKGSQVVNAVSKSAKIVAVFTKLCSSNSGQLYDYLQSEIKGVMHVSTAPAQFADQDPY